MQTLQLFIDIVQDHRILGYTVLFFAMIFEGELFLAATGMLVGIGAFDPFDSFFFAFSGVLFGDLLWYWLGRYLKTHHSHRVFVSKTIRQVHKILPGLENNPAHVIFLSKFIYGLNHSTILVLGYLEIEFRKFFKVQFFTSFLWCVLFWVLGYFFGAAALAYTHSFSRIVLILFVFLIGMVLTERVIKKYIAKKEKENNKNI